MARITSIAVDGKAVHTLKSTQTHPAISVVVDEVDIEWSRTATVGAFYGVVARCDRVSETKYEVASAQPKCDPFKGWGGVLACEVLVAIRDDRDEAVRSYHKRTGANLHDSAAIVADAVTFVMDAARQRINR